MHVLAQHSLPYLFVKSCSDYTCVSDLISIYLLLKQQQQPICPAYHCTMNFIRFVSLLVLWTVCPSPPAMAMVKAGWPPQHVDSLHQTTFINDGAPRYYEWESMEYRPLPSIVPPPALAPASHRRKHRWKRAPPPHGRIRANHRRRKNTNNLKSARTVGYFFGGIAMLLQVAVVAFLLIKRKQMMGVVHKYDETTTPEWNGIHAPA